MNLIVLPSQSLSGAVRLPGDKSLSHRAALLAALAEGDSRIENFLVAGVTLPLLEALAALGVSWTLDGSTLVVHGKGFSGLRPPAGPVFCGNSATVLRLLAGVLAAAGIPAVLDGSEGLRRRPMQRIVEPLQRMGVPIQASPQGTAPLQLSARLGNQLLRALTYRLPVASAQVKSCLLLAALAGEGPTTLIEPGPSRDHTERMLRSMGVAVHSEMIRAQPGSQVSHAVTLTPPAHWRPAPLHLDLPGDFSSAAFLIVAALITPGSALVLKETGLNPTRTGLLDVLREMGADIEITRLSERGGEPVADLCVRYGSLHGTTVDGARVVRMIDEFPAFAVAAAFAQGRSVVREAAELRYKESDRITALGQELQILGIAFEETPDGFTITGGAPVRGGTVRAHGDHRLAMALAVAGLAAQAPVVVEEAGIINESFPGFASGPQALLPSLGARVAVETQPAGTLPGEGAFSGSAQDD